jgi:hypothetical protein
MTDVARVPLVEEKKVRAKEPGVTFTELVWAHFQWERELYEHGAARAEVRREFHEKLGRFRQQEGKLLNAYWSRLTPAAVAVSIKRAPRPLCWLGKDPELRFHRVTDWLTKDAPAMANVLHRCDVMAIRTSEVLRGTTERIAMLWVLAVASHILGCLDRADGKPDAVADRGIAAEQMKELDKVEDYYDRAGSKAGRIVYFWGMMAGVLVLALLAPIIAGLLYLGGLWDGPNAAETNLFFACYAAGALGAVVSVLQRMASEKTKFVLDYEVGRKAIRRLGSFRPFIGAIFGLAVYFVVQSGVLQFEPPAEKEFYFFTTIAFLAGFSERFTKVILDQAEGRLGDPEAGEAEEEPTPEPSQARRPRAPTKEALVTDAAGEPVDVEALEQELSRAARGPEEVSEPRQRDST